MQFTIVSLFPEFFDSFLSCGLMAKAVEAGVVAVDRVNPRDFALDRHHTVDDRPYGGGPGMVMGLPTMAAALRSLPRPGKLLMLSPAGKPLTQQMAGELAGEEALTLLCGRYEGIDARIFDLFDITPVSVGDFVLSGGESAAACLMEAVARLVPGFMGKDASADEESFSSGLLEYPHYTRPEVFEGLPVPPELLSGHHAAIADWRRRRSLETTLGLRPDLFDQTAIGVADADFLRSRPRTRSGRNMHLGLVHGPVVLKDGKVGTVSLTNLDVHDIARVSRTYGLGGFEVVSPLRDQLTLAGRIVDHWRTGPGSRANPDRGEALSLVRLHEGLDAALAAVAADHGREAALVATSAKGPATLSFAAAREMIRARPVLVVLGTGHGLAEEVLARAEGVLPPLRPFSDYNHLSVRAAAGILTDRLLGDAS
ncbi:tRNA (guanine-N(1)-)-methyltransferase [Solidesulfovibrio carbinoliphilus subsp. oakridgensis]|uniref:tRNA (guanine-N(1)-)-methyltransferase n=1 Tax=Solidesulfovibrio carbinoliphilus subsp. oakridgensis TaxID=694327 RepID=G7QBC5_9BACT|nr:tRNA (guanosine(37)-N1)-methyltransferase TrmD [Solidesulfovibrio carbinoliphilus]EHJ49348.1 tRNA (guanine-N(1)-)-methyltransferase [Solidesulfovibrio carbinoliphilus subsp. oakridgensis]